MDSLWKVAVHRPRMQGAVIPPASWQLPAFPFFISPCSAYFALDVLDVSCSDSKGQSSCGRHTWSPGADKVAKCV